MVDLILFSIALCGSAVASYYDLRTTEVPDEVFHVMILLALPFVLIKILSREFYFHYLMPLLAFSYLMYKFGQWGGADSVLFAIIVTLVQRAPNAFSPKLVFPIQFSFTFNIFFIGAVYTVLYAIFEASRNKKFTRAFIGEISRMKRNFLLIFILFFAILHAIFSYFNFPLQQALMLSLSFAFTAISLTILFKFLRLVESKIFRKRIPVSKLKIGDMLLERRELVGITRMELRQIKKSGKKYVWIKTGVRFVPVFFATLLFTVVCGDVLILFTQFLS